MMSLIQNNQQLNEFQIKETLDILDALNKVHTVQINQDKNNSVSDETCCPVTNEKLYEVLKSGAHGYLSPHGQCINCNKYYAYSEFNFSEGASKPQWPMRFIGMTCKLCLHEQDLE